MKKLKLENKNGLNIREHMTATNCKDAIAEFDLEVCGKPRSVVIRVITETKRYEKMTGDLIKYIADYYKCSTDWDDLGKHISPKTVPIMLWIDCENKKAGITKWTTNKVHMTGMTNYLLKLAGFPEMCKPYEAKNEKQKRRVKDLSTSTTTA